MQSDSSLSDSANFCDSDKQRTRLLYHEISDKSSFKCSPHAFQYAVTSFYLSFWAPFLLLHLGGPDNVTSLSAEENNMWLQQLIRMISQIGSTIVNFIRFARSGGLKESSATQVKLQAGPDFEKLSDRGTMGNERGQPPRPSAACAVTSEEIQASFSDSTGCGINEVPLIEPEAETSSPPPLPSPTDSSPPSASETSLDDIDRLHNRISMLDVVGELELNLETTTTVADGSVKSHKMSLLFN
ncbi:hypothetical protein RHGRI_019389 [Rhododendron griersonianum]|uniref:DUF4220 domain-containing protein n=1 Tax=Rhododendron griersonianum TaxID=479676 RepID=A0AAV6JJS9_9ERIC|nr:hypothetical protein RHGRI_019389 [Rhododendron griersonianum]